VLLGERQEPFQPVVGQPRVIVEERHVPACRVGEGGPDPEVAGGGKQEVPSRFDQSDSRVMGTDVVLASVLRAVVHDDDERPSRGLPLDRAQAGVQAIP
jgi:hypothetical protein